MAKTKKEVLSEFGKKMQDAYRKKQEGLQRLGNINWLTNETIKKAKDDIIKSFDIEMAEIEGTSWYKEALELAREEGRKKHKMNRAKKEKEALQKEYQKRFAEADRNIHETTRSYEDAQLAYRWKVEQETVKAVNINKFSRNLETVIADLLSNHVKIHENEEMMWYKWKKVSIDLPAIWDFKWDGFHFFVSDDLVSFFDFEKKPIWKKALWMKSKLEKWSFLSSRLDDFKFALQKYILQFFKNYSYDKKYWNDGKTWFDDDDVKECLRRITWLNDSYWLYNDTTDFSAACWEVDGSYVSHLPVTEDWKRWVKKKLLLKSD